MLELVDLPTEKVIRELAARYRNLEVDAKAVESGLLFLKIGSEILRLADSHFAKDKISQSRFSVMMLLMRDRVQGIAPSNLAERAGVTRATMTGLIDGLEKEGLARRKIDRADKRRQTIELTPKGIRVIDKVYPPHLVRMTFLMGVLTNKEKKELAKILGKMRKRLCAIKSDPTQ